MAVKKALEVVPSLPTQPEQDLEALLAPRLADELINNVDIAKLARLTISHIGKGFQQRLINWLISEGGSRVALTEIDAIASSDEDVAA